jgi:hypothetical protein
MTTHTTKTRVFDIDLAVKVTLTAPADVTEEQALDAIYCLVATPTRRNFKIASEIIDADVVSVKEQP